MLNTQSSADFGQHSNYFSEKIKVHEVPTVLQLGKYTAYTFLQWVKHNPCGVISLPTGKTPQAFILALKHIKQNWHSDVVQKEAVQYGLQGPHFPQTSGLTFVQMDEFFLMYPGQKNSFSSYIIRNYLSLLEIPESQFLCMDFSKMGFELNEVVRRLFVYERPSVLSKEENKIKEKVFDCVQKFCVEYEAKIKALGGIGFFLGGIGPDGHIAFNISGSSKDSVTRLVQLNYPSAAAASTSLGGIEFSRDKLVMTIGMHTIMQKSHTKIMIMAAGEAKSEVVARAVQDPVSKTCVASYLQNHAHAEFVITKGAARFLHARLYARLQQCCVQNCVECIEYVCHTIALDCKKSLRDVTAVDYAQHRLQGVLPGDSLQWFVLCHQRLLDKVQQGTVQVAHKSIMHTSPHHDDILLSYYAYAKRFLTQTKNMFLMVTSGFNAVTNKYVQGLLKGIDQLFIQTYEQEIFQDPYEKIMDLFSQAYTKQDFTAQKIIERIVIARHIRDIFEGYTVASLLEAVDWLVYGYFPHVYPGKKDIPAVQVLKGALRESEEDRVWTVSGVSLSRVVHLRSQFYTGDFFVPQPTIQSDARPIASYFESFAPDVITVALDPEGTGPDTHYKVLQVVARALEMYQNKKQDLQIWGYRNVWHRFMPHEVNRMILVTQEEIDSMEQLFLRCYATQKTAPFPAVHFDGPFSTLVKQVLQDQYEQIKLLVGDDAQLAGFAGCIFLKTMNEQEFLEYVKDVSVTK